MLAPSIVARGPHAPGSHRVLTARQAYDQIGRQLSGYVRRDRRPAAPKGNRPGNEGFDDELWAAMEHERIRQEDHIELIASENYTSPRVLQARGSVLTNKYAEGYPGKRCYGG